MSNLRRARFFNPALWLAAACLLPALRAQVAVEVAFDKDQYLPAEDIILAVKITNFSGRTLHLGKDPSWLDLFVERTDGKYVRQIAEPPVVYPFDLPSSSRATRRLNIAPYFDMREPGQYKLTATVRIPELQIEVSGKPGSFTVINGSPIWEQPFGFTPPGKSGGQPEIRRYALIQTTQGRRMRLYVRVSGPYGIRIYRVFPIGIVLTFSRPEAQIDRAGNLHVLWQTAAKDFTYVVVDPNGKLKARQTYRYAFTRPRLQPGKDGTVRVAGGARIRTRGDYPPEKPSSSEKPDAAAPRPPEPTKGQPLPPNPASGSQEAPSGE